jgi:hypothetical protein
MPAGDPQIAASRARILAAADEARRSLERDLHDGAQQQLVLAAVTLRRAEARARGHVSGAAVTEALGRLRQALNELRDLARGIRPAVFSERGLAAAPGRPIARSPVPSSCGAPGGRVEPLPRRRSTSSSRRPSQIRQKHAQARLARVQVEVQGRTLTAQSQTTESEAGTPQPAPDYAASATAWTRSAGR